ncbi:MAG: TAT-variant-translocated molybdopterin oxidoreductase, partial [Phycisphaerae bacterium]|nr:TAT-variant-translocated molybdopterin oxidoreductase [Phycisphaerae bacterium]
MPSLDRNKTGKAYWRSLDELADAPRFREALENEFLNYAPAELVHAPNRRHFMKLMGASMALAGAAGLPGCRRWPQRKLAPYAERPEGRIPGIPERFATVHELGGVARPVLVSSFDGRPVKVEGNPDYPQSRGAADAFAQASVLSLYDPQRSKRVMAGKGDAAAKSSWEAFAKAIAPARSGGEGLAICSEATASPTVAALKKKLPQAKWFTWEPLNDDHGRAGARQAFGRPLRSHLHLDQAKVIVCFDADPLGAHPQALKHSADWARGRRAADHGQISRLYVAEGTFSLTGTNADQRLGTRSSRVGQLVQAIASILEGESSDKASDEAGTFAAAVAADLLAHRGQGLVVAGPTQPPAVHALCHRINQQLGNVGKTITFTEPAGSDQPTGADSIAALAAALNGGQVKTLVILGGNPAYDAPADLDLAAAIAKAQTSVHLGDYRNETSVLCDWSLPRSHYLEAWGDARGWDGTVSVVQPLILPLYDTRSLIEVLALLAGDELTAGYDLVRRSFKQFSGAGTEKGWRRALHDGFLADSADAPVSPPSAPAVQLSGAAATGDYEVVFTADPTIHDGRFAGNAWLQEMPDPVTKLTWDNAAIMAAKTAEKLGLG